MSGIKQLWLDMQFYHQANYVGKYYEPLCKLCAESEVLTTAQLVEVDPGAFDAEPVQVEEEYAE